MLGGCAEDGVLGGCVGSGVLGSAPKQVDKHAANRGMQPTCMHACAQSSAWPLFQQPAAREKEAFDTPIPSLHDVGKSSTIIIQKKTRRPAPGPRTGPA